jgi:Kef-type K+ transport system membrane component KefB
MTDFWKELINEFSLPLSNPILSFSLILLIILLSPMVLKRLKIPGIIGLIISGVIIGPYGFNIIEMNSAVELFSTIGLLYILFIAGLDLNIAQFKANKNKSLLFGFFTFSLPLMIGFVLCYYLLNYSFDASILTASMFATHTLVAYPIVSKMGITKNEAVSITVGGTILTDTAVLMILAIIINNSEGGLNGNFFIRLGISFIVFLFIMFFIIPKIARLFFRKLESEKHAHYIFVLAVLFFSAFLAEIAGLEPIIGAFVAGLALNPLIPRTSSLMNRIEFSGNALFIPFFLISVGMIVDIKVILNGWNALLVAGVLTFGAIFGKWLAALFTQLIYKFTKSQRQLIFGLSTSHAAATLAVILVGYKVGILDEIILNGTIILILITCIVASFVTEKSSRRLLLEDDTPVIPNRKKFLGSEHIILPIANMTGFTKLLDLAFLIKNKKSANPITILSVVPNDEMAEINILATREKLEEYIKQGAASEIAVNTIATIDHNSVSGISRISRELLADILVLGWPGKAGIIDKIAGDKINSIINSVDKNIFVCSLDEPINNHKRIVLVTPPLAEKENGFTLWASKIIRLCSELETTLIHFGEKEVDLAFKEVLKKKKVDVKTDFQHFENWEDFLILSKHINVNDLLIIVSARKNSVSYTPYFDNIFNKTEKYFQNNNRIIVFPQQSDSYSDKFEDLTGSTLTKGFEAIGNLGKGFGKIFNKEL